MQIVRVNYQFSSVEVVNVTFQNQEFPLLLRREGYVPILPPDGCVPLGNNLMKHTSFPLSYMLSNKRWSTF